MEDLKKENKQTDGISLTWLLCDNVRVMCMRFHNTKSDWLQDSNNECSSSSSSLLM